LIKLSC